MNTTGNTNQPRAATQPGQAVPTAALPGQIDIPQVSFLYRFALTVVGLAIILLPLIYIGLIGMVAWSIFYMATHTGYASGRHVRTSAAIFLYIIPLITGIILLFFMVKPLLAKRSKFAKPYSLDRNRQPKFFEFAEKIAEMVGAPAPRRIDLDCDVNASAGFRRGFLSFFGNDLVLTVGLPLVSGLTVRQLGGVLAHEFGHFTQGTGMRLSYLIRRIINWFIRVVYERDAWDDRLIDWCRGGDIKFTIPIYLARAMVWLTRRVLWVLMHIGMILTSFLMRQGEYDADLYEVAIGGTDAFAKSFKKMRTLAVASQGAHADLSMSWQERRLCDNLPAMICATVNDIPADILKKVHDEAMKTRTGLFDTHPSDKDRIARAAEMNLPGLITCDQPSRTLFSDYSSLSRDVTFEYYQQVIGPEINASNLVSTRTLINEQKGMVEDRKVAVRYFQNLLTSLRPLTFAMPSEDGADFDRVASTLVASRQRMLAELPAIQATLKCFDSLDNKAIEVIQAMILRQCGFRLPPSLQPPAGVPVEQHGRQVNEQLYAAAAALDKRLHDPATRFRAAVKLPYCQGAADRLPNVEELRADIQKIMPAIHTFLSGFNHLQNLRFNYYRVLVMLKNHKGSEENAKLVETILKTANRCRDDMQNLRSTLESCTYPFEHASGTISIGQYAVEKIPASEHEVGLILATCEDIFEKLLCLYYRMMGRLASVAERVESTLGLPPLPEPPEEKKESKPA